MRCYANSSALSIDSVLKGDEVLGEVVCKLLFKFCYSSAFTK